MKMEPRISIVTLGVGDLDRAVAFYAAMGLTRDERFTDGVAFYQMGGMILALWPRDALARDAGIPGEVADRTAFSSVALAHNTRTDEEVAIILDKARRAGGRVLREAARAFWGGVQGYFEDTEGNLWEVAHNPDFPIDPEGRISLPK